MYTYIAYMDVVKWFFFSMKTTDTNLLPYYSLTFLFNLDWYIYRVANSCRPPLIGKLIIDKTQIFWCANWFQSQFAHLGNPFFKLLASLYIYYCSFFYWCVFIYWLIKIIFMIYIFLSGISSSVPSSGKKHLVCRSRIF